jgi:hypothetical protein
MLRGLSGAVLEVAPNKFNERRVRCYTLPLRSLVAIFSGRVKIEGETLPVDAEIGHVAPDVVRNAISVFVYSDEFPTVPECEMIPEGGGIGLKYYQYPEGK